MRKPLFAILFLCLASCSKGADANSIACATGPSATPKSLFSSWTAKDCSETLDLTAAYVGFSSAMVFKFTDGARCACTNTLCGTTASGSYLFTSCSYAGGGTGDPGCANLSGHGGNFTASNTELVICDTTCTTYW
jgi:hypothetical protein